jgi:branched-chain amino acid transport system ATP-binding protein
MTDPAVQAAYLGGGGISAPSPSRPSPSASKEAPKETLPNKITVGRLSQTRQTADSLVGLNVSDLVKRAENSAKAVPKTPMAKGTTTSNSDIDAMLKEFEIAAARAGQQRPLSRYEPAKHNRPKPASLPIRDEKPVTVEVYRAPRVDVYRRRKNGDFERD